MEVVKMPYGEWPGRGQVGQGMLEYSLIILFVVLIVFGGLILVGPAVANVFGSVLPDL